jgi:hypothetical protein
MEKLRRLLIFICLAVVDFIGPGEAKRIHKRLDISTKTGRTQALNLADACRKGTARPDMA